MLKTFMKMLVVTLITLLAIWGLITICDTIDSAGAADPELWLAVYEAPIGPEKVYEVRLRKPYRYEQRYLIPLHKAETDMLTGTKWERMVTAVNNENAVESQKTASYAVFEDDLSLLSWIMYCEAGSSWIPDEIQLYVGSVVLNRVASGSFPNTLYEVIYQPGQYYPVSAGWTCTPDDRTIENARYLLENGSVLPANVVFQANFSQGSGIYYQYDDPYLGSSYFCYA